MMCRGEIVNGCSEHGVLKCIKNTSLGAVLELLNKLVMIGTIELLLSPRKLLEGRVHGGLRKVIYVVAHDFLRKP